MEVWGGLECSINRVKDDFFDQLDYSGHYNRMEDIRLFAKLGIKKVRYPVLWEKHQPKENGNIDWTQTTKRLNELRNNNIEVIAGLVHHGSGPAYVSMLDDTFADGLAAYAGKVARQFPWITHYTPVNEPLTTARFCGLYGIWYPHKTDDVSFFRILLNECKGIILAMREIRKVNPNASLVQTDDLGKIHSTPLLKYQADFENHRLWLSYDLLCGKVNKSHPLFNFLLNAGITREELRFFEKNNCKPDILGFNHYLTSERYLDENLENYPPHTHGGNGIHRYADVEAVRVGNGGADGSYRLLKEAWNRYKLPMAVTEVHLYCTREEQMRWLNHLWTTANRLKDEGVNICAITAWALLGSFGWNRLLTQPNGDYETGVFDLSGGRLRTTALAKMISSYNFVQHYSHPVLDSPGWWARNCRVVYGDNCSDEPDFSSGHHQPLLIAGKTGTLGNAFARICELRGICHILLGRDELDITDPAAIESVIKKYNPWAIINTTGFVRVDDAEMNSGSCFAVNAYGAKNLAISCEKYGIKFQTFSSDLVFNGKKSLPYLEHDKLAPLNVYGQSKALAERAVLKHNREALVIRTSAFFGPWDRYNFVKVVIDCLQSDRHFKVAKDVTVSPTYLPDLVNTSLNLLLDDERGIWHLSNDGNITWSDFAYSVAERLDLNTSLIEPLPVSDLGFKAKRPLYSALTSRRGMILPQLDHAIERCLADIIS